MPLNQGDKLGPYQIVEPIGKGGMGDVYRARDSRIGRDVAIKQSAERFSERFSHEVHAVAALNHPNVCTLYDVGENYLVMELIEGPTLAERIRQGPLALDEALGIARQIGAALEAAHEKGIVHRDLKPGNVKLTADGAVKVLDFGLAKFEPIPGTLTDESPTFTMQMTNAGMIMGTAAYMAPEQARGRNVDKRADIWAFGVVLYELLTGKRPFQGEDLTETLAAVVKTAPDLDAAPQPVRRLLQSCLEKDPRKRLRDIGDWEHLVDRHDPAPAQVAVTRRFTPLGWIAAALLLAAVGLGAAMYRKPQSTAADLSAYKFAPISTDEAVEYEPAWAPDGKTIAYTRRVRGVFQVFTRGLDSAHAAQLTRESRDARSPVWSPDGSTIYYFTIGPGPIVWAVAATGGTPELIFKSAGVPRIHPDGKTIAFLRTGRVWIGRRGEEAREFVMPPELAGKSTDPRVLLGFSPDGSKLALLSGNKLWILPYPSGPGRSFAAEYDSGSWMPDSRRLVLQTTSLASEMSILDTADGNRRRFYKSPGLLLHAAVSPDGKRIAFATGRIQSAVLEVEIPHGRVHALRASGEPLYYPQWAPSGTHYLVTARRSTNLVLEDASAIDGFSRTLVAGDEASGSWPGRPRWAPDGTRFTFEQYAPGGVKLMLTDSSGGRITPLDETYQGGTSGAVWSPDGQWIVYTRQGVRDGEMQVARIHPGSTAGPEILARFKRGAPDRRFPLQWSPDLKWILCFTPDGLFLVSPDFQHERRIASRIITTALPVAGFSKDGRQVIALLRNTSGEGAGWQLYAIDVATGAERKLADVDLPATTEWTEGFSLHPDGTRFVTSSSSDSYDIWMLEGFDNR